MSGQPYSIGKLTRSRTDGRKYSSFCIIWRDTNGSRRRVSLGTTDKVAALAAARDLWGKLTLVSADTIGQIVEAYLDGLNGERDEKRKRECWAAAKPFWGGLRLGDVDKNTSQTDYPAWRKRAANTLRNELGMIRTALNWAASEKLIEAAPKVYLPAMPESSVEHLTKAQFRLFLDHCKAPHVKLFAMLAVTTGARKTALLQLTWDRIDFDRKLIHLNPKGRAQVGNKGRATVPLSDMVQDALREARGGTLSEYVIEHGGQPLGDIKKGIAAAAVRAGFHVHPHMFRHSAAVWMAEDRVPMEEIASFLGHKDSRITARVYAKFNPDYLRRAASSLTW